jgi:predicted RNA methylase
VDLAALEQLSVALAGERARGIDDRVGARARGAFFTPPALAAFVAEAVIAPLRGGPVAVLDPAAGDGRFLAAAAAAGATRLVGIERDPATAAAAREVVPAATIVVGEALLGRVEVGEVDAVVGNPPYVRSIHLRASDPALWEALRGKFAATSHGEWDLYGAFLERSLAWVRPGGRVGLVVPSRWLTARASARLRAHLAGAVEAIVDFGARQLFDGATTYTSVVVMARGGRRVSAIARRGEAGWSAGEVDTEAAGAAPWVARGTDEARWFARASGPTLGACAQIVKGAGTNADGVFVIEDAVVEGEVVRGRTRLGEVAIERAAARPVLRGRDVVGWRSAPTAWCVVPYDARGLIEWDELVVRWPRAAAHLAAARGVLEARERGRFAGARFHGFGRPQNLAMFLGDAPKVVVPDVVAEGRACLDVGSFVLDSAYALRTRADAPGGYGSPWLHLAILSSPVVRRWLALAGTPLRGGYARMKTAYLAPLPLPAMGPALRRAEEAARAGAREACHAAVVAAYGGG